MPERSVAETQMLALTLHQVFQERELDFDVVFRHRGEPYAGAPVRVYTDRRDGGATPLFLERRLDRDGRSAEHVRYAASWLEFSLDCRKGWTDSPFAEVSLAVFRPGTRLAALAFELDTEDFVLSELDRGTPGELALLFTVQPGYPMLSLAVGAAGLAPTVVSAKRAQAIASFEKFDMDRFLIVLDVRQYLAANSFFLPPLRPGEQLAFDFHVTLETPRGAVRETRAAAGDAPYDETYWTRRARLWLDEAPPADPQTTLAFRFRCPVTLRQGMLPG